MPSLKAIHKAGHDIASVVTQPAKPAGRGMKLTHPPAATVAKELGLILYQPNSIRNPKVIEKIRSLNPDIIVVVAYGKLLPNELLKIPKYGCINLHSSLLPKYRGAAPINWAIVNGESETGVTTMFIAEELDAGDILLQKRVEIEYHDTSITLHDKLAEIGANLVIETINGLVNRTIEPAQQDHARATFAPTIKKEDGLINWKKSAQEIRNLVRGMQPWPSAHTHLDGKLLKIFDAEVLDEETLERPGVVVAADDGIVVATGRGKLCINELQMEGRRKMTSMEFLRGHDIKTGIVMGLR